MLVNKDKFKLEILEGMFKGNYNQCAKALGIEVAQLHRFVKTSHSEAGAKFLGGLFVFCEQNNLVFRDYIFLPIPSTGVYENRRLKESA
jgi:hypothetical protein